MITRVQATNFRCFDSLDLKLPTPTCAIYGRIATGKSSILDVVNLIRAVVTEGPEIAVHSRTSNFFDLVYMRPSTPRRRIADHGIPFIELGIELESPFVIVDQQANIRYEIRIGVDENHEIGILSESAALRIGDSVKLLCGKDRQGVDRYYWDDAQGGSAPRVRRRSVAIRHGSQKSAVAECPPDGGKFPIVMWLKEFFGKGISYWDMNDNALRNASPAVRDHIVLGDGSELPWLLAELLSRESDLFLRRLSQGLDNIEVITREDVNHSYVMLTYRDGSRLPSWMASAGELRLIALSAIAQHCKQTPGKLYMVKDPGRGLSADLAEAIMRSLASVEKTQMIITTADDNAIRIFNRGNVIATSRTHSGRIDVRYITAEPMA